MAPSTWTTVNGQTTRRPGVFSKTDGSALAGVGPASRGILALLLESPYGGSPLTINDISNAGQFKRLIPDPLGTPLAKCLFNPSADPRIPSGVTGVKVIRVNPALRASLTVGADPDMKINAYDWGVFGNSVQVKMETGTLASSKKVTAVLGSTTEVKDSIVVNTPVLNLSLTDSITDVDVTAHVNTASVAPRHTLGEAGASSVAIHQAVSIAEAHTWTPAAGDSVAFDSKITFQTVTAQTGKTATVIGIDKATGLPVTDTVNCTNTPTSTTHDFSAVTSIQIPGTLATDTTVAVSWYAFDLSPVTFNTIGKVIAKVQTQADRGFAATAGIGQTTFAIADMDAAGPTSLPGAGTVVPFLAQLYYLITAINSNFTLITAERVTATGDAIPTNFGPTALAGGTDGVADLAAYTAGLNLLKSQDVSHVVCMTTDASVAAALKDHVQYMAGIGRNERYGFVGLPAKSSKADIQSAIVALADRNIVPWINEVGLYDYTGTPTVYGPEYEALAEAACDCGRSNEYGLTWTYPDFLAVYENPGSGAANWTSQDDAETLLGYAANFCSYNPANSIWRVERAVTAHLIDDNPIFTSAYANESANFSTKNVRRRIETMIGHGVFTGTAEDVRQLTLTELQRQVTAKEIKAYDPRSVTVVDLGNGFDVDYMAAFTEELLFVNQTAHAVRIPTSA